MLEIEKLTVCFGDRCVLDAVSMSVKREKFLELWVSQAQERL